MIYRASHHFFLYPFFRFYSVWKTKRNFSGVSVRSSFSDRGLPVLLISNHFSWWDGFWAVYINEKLFHRTFWFMMLEEQLTKHMFFNKTGGFSVKKGSRSIVETIDYAALLLSDRKNLVLMFPQGEIRSMHTPEIVFEKGIEHIIKKVSGRIHLVFLANIIDYFSSERAGLFMYLREYSGNDFTTETLCREYNRFYSECISENLKMTDA